MTLTIANRKTDRKWWILAFVLFAALVGSFMSMLRWELQLIASLFDGTFGFSGLADGFGLVFNRLFAVSEHYQAYRYIMFAIDLPESTWDAHISAALVIIFALFAATSALLMYFGRKAPIIITMLLVVGIQIYFGVFPHGLWNIALFTAFALILARCYVVITAAVALVAAIVLATYSGENPQLHAFSESLRDRFDTRMGQFVDARHDVQAANGFAYNPEHVALNVVEVQGSNLHESAREDYLVEHDERAGGAEVGTAIPSQSIITILIMTLIMLVTTAIAMRLVPPLIKAAKRRKSFELDDYAVAINNMFVYMLDWLAVHGLRRRNVVFSAYTSQLSELVSQQYSQQYEDILELWREAVYSSHAPGQGERGQMREFLDETRHMVWESSDIRTKIKIKLHYFL